MGPINYSKISNNLHGLDVFGTPAGKQLIRVNRVPKAVATTLRGLTSLATWWDKNGERCIQQANQPVATGKGKTASRKKAKAATSSTN